ncbi:hypothetical protein PQX77_014596 [Marasmius sp. AFHP31]|nr:hypothetical protein PQX77_014596 [Marasmius sp. AFHP31]
MSLLLAALFYRQLDSDSAAPTPSSSGETRTSAGVIWSCLSMIILCTWTSVRPNIPCVPRSGHWTLVWWDDAKIFLVALIAPEFIVQWSIRQWFAAREMAKKYQKKGYDWTTTHAFFALMGGFALYDSEGNFLFHLWDQEFFHPDQNGQDSCDTQLQKLQELHSNRELEDLYPHHGNSWYKSPLEYCVANKLIFVTEDEIESLGDTDFLAKIIAIFQTLYFITNCIARVVSGLAITEFEFLTLGFAALNLVSYSFWWHKPSRVRFPVRVMARLKSPSPQPSSNSEGQDEEPKFRLPRTGIPAMPSEARAPRILSAFSNRIWDDYGDGEWNTWSIRRRISWILLLPLRAARRTSAYAIDLDSSRQFEHGNIFFTGYSQVQENHTLLLMLFTAVLLGIFHCIPIIFNYHDFPGHTQDHHLWTVFALLTTVLPLGAPILAIAGATLDVLFVNWEGEGRPKNLWIMAGVLYSILALYVAARIALMALAAKQLIDLPPSALQQVQWTTLIPHFGV